jgi:hypothetical protein
MSDETPRDPDPVSNPALPWQINLIGFGLLVLTIIVLYVLIASWPVLVETGPKDGPRIKKFAEFVLFGVWCDWAADKRLLFTVALAGAVGSMPPVLTSIATYVGNRRFSLNWVWWYILRAPIGVALALLFYFVVRGSLMLPTVSNASGIAQDATTALNVYGIAAFSALAGMFSKQATDKLEEVFNAVFSRKEDVKRKDSLSGSANLTFDPRKLTRGNRQDLTVKGRGFKQGVSKATVNEEPRTFTVQNEATGTLEIKDKDVQTAGNLRVVITTDDQTLGGVVNVSE